MTRRTALVLAAVPAAFLAVFFVWPLVSILATGLAPGGEVDLGPFGEVLTDGDLLGVAWFTVWQAAASTVLALLAGLPAAWVFARFDFPGRSVLRALTTVPFVMPSVVVAAAFIALVGEDGLLGVELTGTVWVVLLAHVFYNLAVVIRTVGGLWSHLDPRLEEAARALGATPVRTFRSVTLPLLRPALAAASSVVFLFSFTSFGIVLLLAGPRITTLEVEIYRHTAVLLDLPTAAVLAVLQLVGVGLILRAYARRQEAVEQPLRAAVETARRPRSRGERLAVGGIVGATLLLLLGPLMVLVERSLRLAGGGRGLDAYRAIAREEGLVDGMRAIGNSLAFAGVAAAIALGVGLLAAYVVARRAGSLSSWFDSLLMLPLGTSAVTLGFGFVVALDHPVDLRTAWILVPVAHALVAIPFVVRLAVPVLRSMSTRLREAAAVLGAGPRQVWASVELPLVSRAATVGGAFAFAVSLGEFGATVFVARPGSGTVPLAIFRLLGRPGAASAAEAMALAVVLMALTALAVLAVERVRLPGSVF